MIHYITQDPLWVRIFQASGTMLLVFLALFVAHRFGIKLLREGGLALLRGLLQVVGVGLLLVAVFRGPSWLAPIVLLCMMGIGTQIASSRVHKLPRTRTIIFSSILLSVGVSLVLTLALGIIETRSTAMIPIGSMMIANAMNTISLALERLQGEIKSHTGQIEAALSLGASPAQAIAPMIQTAVQASLIPRIDTMRSLGIVWIPGLMTGMLLGGEDPLRSALYQFVIVALILGVGAFASLSAVLMLRPALFNQAEQLLEN
ncbi:MAG: ABC transporter permease [Myxococcales bacterium]|nr:ABC transporter permease [Myxococcales bacterium]MCB9641694.1 ABC transporter permease [Myxococcales bacterium]